MAQPDGEWEAPSKELKGSRPHHREADHLSSRILARVPDSDHAREFVEHRFRFPLVNYRRRSTAAAALHIGINLLTALAGLSTAAIVAAGGDSGFWKSMIIAIGLLVGLLSGMNQILRPGQKNLAFARTWMDLRTQGWQYVCGLGVYSSRLNADPDAESRETWLRFAANVIGAQQEAEKIAEPGGDTAEAAAAGEKHRADSPP
jgi:hypothetical protein